MRTKLLAAVLAMTLVLSLAACANDAKTPDNTENPPVENKPSDSSTTPDKPSDPPSGGTEPPVSGDDPTPPEPPAEVDLTEVRAAMWQELSVADPLPMETDMLGDLYGIEAAWVKQSACFVTMSGAFPDEVILVEAADEASADQVAAKLQTKLEQFMSQAQTYDPASYAAAQNCQVQRSGCFVSLILSALWEEYGQIYARYVK